MTGQGQAQVANREYSVSVEIRAVNSRYLKVNCHYSENLASRMADVESRIRQDVRRGTVTVHLRLDVLATPNKFRLDAEVLQGYRDQLTEITGQPPQDLTALLALPGVVVDKPLPTEDETAVQQALVDEAVIAALKQFLEMRVTEGLAMAKELSQQVQEIRNLANAIKTRAPLVVESYGTRLQERINQMLANLNMEIDRRDIVREIGIFSDRCDIAEELVRLDSHLEQFESILTDSDSSGRKLEFLTQEILRETNTIGSKANDAAIANHVVDIKTVVERMREMVQNVE